MNEIEAKRIEEIRKRSMIDCDIAQQNLCDVDPNNIDIETTIILNSLHNKGFNLGVEMGDKQGYERARKENIKEYEIIIYEYQKTIEVMEEMIKHQQKTINKFNLMLKELEVEE